MKSFQVGDRVKVYHGAAYEGVKGTVTTEPAGLGIGVRIDGEDNGQWFCLKQLIRLKPKPKREPLRIWVDYIGLMRGDYSTKKTGSVEFVEVIKK